MIATLLGPDGRWRFGAGDDTPLGWALFAGYLIGAVLAFAAFRHCRSELRRLGAAAPSEATSYRSLAEFWMIVAFALLVLGPNKQLDLQTLAIQTARDMAHSEGWYDQRVRVQLAFLVLLLVATAAASLWLTWHLRRVLRRSYLALLGFALILGYAALRASAMEKVPQLHGDSPRLWVIEATGIMLVCVAAVRMLRAR